MATLNSDSYAMEMTLRWDENVEVIYDLVFKWRGLPILNEEIMKRENKWWAQGPLNGVFSSEYSQFQPALFFRKMLKATQPDYLESIDPDIRITIFPNHVVPGERFEVLWEADSVKKSREEREARKRELGELPDDLFEIHFFIDTYNFSECPAYSGDGVSFVFVVYRTELERFVNQLENERQELVAIKENTPNGT